MDTQHSNISRSGSGNSSNGLGKLLPRSLTAKRRMKKRRQAQDKDGEGLGADEPRGRYLSSRGESDEDENDDRSFGSYDSSADTADVDSQPPQSTDSLSKSSTPQPTRPNTLSTHPSLIGYLTTSSPQVQATHLSPQSRSTPPTLPQSTSSHKLGTRGVSPVRLSESSDVNLGSPIIAPAAVKMSGPDRRSRAPPSRIEPVAPRTPPKAEKPAPTILNTPPTPTAEDSLSSASPDRKTKWNASPVSSADDGALSRNMNIHRRSKSGSATIGPSKLSNITTAPLTPTAEAGDPPLSATGFFSSMISAAQNAANTFSNGIPGGAGMGMGANKKQPAQNKVQDTAVPSQPEAPPPPPPVPEIRTDNSLDRKESAVRTLGTGELSLSQLGLSEPSSTFVSPANMKFPDVMDTRARSESAPVDGQTRSTEFIPEEGSSRPRSLIESQSGDQTPPRAEASEHISDIQRSSSLRSAMKPHRKRGSSVTTGATIGAAITATNNSLGQPSTSATGPKLTGFAVASKKRNRDFHNFFKSVPDDDFLIEDYSCALQREILAHGRLYVSEGYLCFSSNILGWTTTLVMSFDEIVSVEKRSTALVFKNGLMISTLHAKHVFASFTSRDATYDLIVNIWKLGHPTLTSTLNGVRLEGTGGDKTEKTDAEPLGGEAEAQAESESEDESDDEGDEEDDFSDEEYDDGVPETQLTETSGAAVGGSEKPAARKVSNMTNSPTEAAKDAPSPPAGATDFPGPASHAPTDCGDVASHYDKVVGDDVIQAPLGKVFDLVFGTSSVAWMSKWLSEDQKCMDIQMEEKSGLGTENRNRTFTYIKPLYQSLGPKQTKCITSETVEAIDLEKSVTINVSTQTPDVPNGGIFCVKTRYCLTWAENNSTRVQANCTTEWSGKSWIKGQIEKHVVDGQVQYCRELFASLRTAVSSRPRAPTATNNGTMKSRKKGRKSKALQSSNDSANANSRSNQATKQDWGILEPIHGIIEPCFDIIKPILTGNVMYGLLVGLLVASWFGFGLSPNKHPSPFGGSLGISSPERLAAYEEMWRREDTELWDWLEERVGLDRLNADSGNVRKKPAESRTVEERVREERMDEREVEEAIRVTEERLKVLKEVVNKASHGREQ